MEILLIHVLQLSASTEQNVVSAYNVFSLEPMKLDKTLIPVCKAGHHRGGSSCIMCSGNEIKSTPGDAADCLADPPCDGATKVPKDDHTACGELDMAIDKNY